MICDEPTSALDPVGRKEILEALQAVKERTTVIFSTHILSDVERICDRIAFLHDGVIALEGTLEEVRAKRKSQELNWSLCLRRRQSAFYRLSEMGKGRRVRECCWKVRRQKTKRRFCNACHAVISF